MYLSNFFFFFFFFFFNDTATTEIYTRPYTLSLHDALPISVVALLGTADDLRHEEARRWHTTGMPEGDRKSTRLNSSHTVLISYAVFCLKKKKIKLRFLCRYEHRHDVGMQLRIVGG